MASVVQICNVALGLLGEFRIVSLDDPTEQAEACSAFYELSRDAVLRAANWNFAVERVAIAPEATGPSWGFVNYFLLPPTCLRVLEVEDENDWKVEGRKLAANIASVNVKYTRQVTDPVEFDALFAMTLAARMAFNMAERLTQSSTKKREAAETYKAFLIEAVGVDAVEGTPDELEEDSWNIARL